MHELPPVTTRLKPDAWESALKAAGGFDEYAEVPEGLRNGFKIGIEHFKLTQTYIPDNHHISERHMAHVREKRDTEIVLGRLSRGYEPDELQSLIGNFRTAPIAVTEPRPGKLRTIINHSFPDKAKPSPEALANASLPEPIMDPTTTSVNSILKQSAKMSTGGHSRNATSW